MVGISSCYKLDVANSTLKLGIELDGPSHHTPKARVLDKKKTDFLSGMGWTVLRFSNREVTNDLEGCVRTVLCTISKLKDSTRT